MMIKFVRVTQRLPLKQLFGFLKFLAQRLSSGLTYKTPMIFGLKEIKLQNLLSCHNATEPYFENNRLKIVSLKSSCIPVKKSILYLLI